MDNKLENSKLKKQLSQYREVAGFLPFLDDGTLRGGYRIVDSIQERDSIDCCHRKIGMVVSVKLNTGDYKNYRLIGTNHCSNNWQEVSTDGDVPGPPGESATIEIGTVTTVGSNESANVINIGTPREAIFDFKIPKGEKGDIGDISLLNFNVNTAMHLIMNLETNTNLNFTLDNNGHLILLQ